MTCTWPDRQRQASSKLGKVTLDWRMTQTLKRHSSLDLGTSASRSESTAFVSKRAGSTERKETTHSTQVAAPKTRAAGHRLACGQELAGKGRKAGKYSNERGRNQQNFVTARATSVGNDSSITAAFREKGFYSPYTCPTRNCHTLVISCEAASRAPACRAQTAKSTVWLPRELGSATLSLID